MGLFRRRPADPAAARRAALGRLAALGALAITGRAAAAGVAAVAEVEFIIDMREQIAAGRFDPAQHEVGVRGAWPPLSWQRSLPAQPGGEPGLYRLRLQFDTVPAQALPYKFKIERGAGADGGWEPGPNRTFGPLREGSALQVARAFGSQPEMPPLSRSGHLDRIAARPSRFVSAREVQVWLPPAYAALPDRRWPVLYLHDGQNVFDALAAGAEWQFDETAQRLALAGTIAPPIVVAVASNDDRVADYTPWQRALDGRAQGGGAAAYGRYLVEELKPLIDARYRTLPGRGDTAVGGSSLGGLVSLWLLLAHAGTFGAGLVVSPALWWDPSALARQLRCTPLPPGLPPPRVWLCAGGREGPTMLPDARRLRTALQQRGWSPGGVEQADGGHDELSWAARVEPMLRFLYGA